MNSITVHKNIIAGLILLLAFLTQAKGQITSPTAHYTDSLMYPQSPGKDPLFVFYQTNKGYKPGTLSATLPETGSYNFEWSKYNPVIEGFDPPFQTDTNVPSSNVEDLEDGGYQVRIFNGTGTDTTLLAWVLLDQLHAWLHKTEDGSFDPKWRDCLRVALNGYVESDTLIYYDPVTHLKLDRMLNFKFKWSSDNEDFSIPLDTIGLAPKILYSPPYDDTWFILTVTDELGMVEVDSVFYESIQTKAEFTIEYYDKIQGTFVEDLDGNFDNNLEKGSTDATLTVRFINKSLNGASYLWVFLDTLGGIRQEETTYSLDEMPEFTYETADKYYYPYMYSYSEEECVDSSKIDAGIQVVKSQLVIPNVFTPNGDIHNNVWVFKHQSLRTCKITVVDRTGKVVYKKEIDDIYEWEGWDGNMHESGRRAPEGQYYFVVEALGYDGVEYKDPSLWSQMKIFGGAGTKDPGGSTGGTNPGGGTGTDPQSDTRYTGWLYLFRH